MLQCFERNTGQGLDWMGCHDVGTGGGQPVGWGEEHSHRAHAGSTARTTFSGNFVWLGRLIGGVVTVASHRHVAMLGMGQDGICIVTQHRLRIPRHHGLHDHAMMQGRAIEHAGRCIALQRKCNQHDPDDEAPEHRMGAGQVEVSLGSG